MKNYEDLDEMNEERVSTLKEWGYDSDEDFIINYMFNGDSEAYESNCLD